MDINDVTQVLANVTAPAVVDPQITKKETTEAKQGPDAPNSDSVEISSEALSANAVQNTPELTEKQETQDKSDNAPESKAEDNQSPNAGVGLETESTGIGSDSSVTEAVRDNVEAKTDKALEGLSDEIMSIRENSAKAIDSRRTTKFSIRDGQVSVKIKRGDKVIDIPPEEVIQTQNNIKTRLDAFVEASNVDIKA